MSYQPRKLTRRSSVSQRNVVPPDLRQYELLGERTKIPKLSANSGQRPQEAAHKRRPIPGTLKLFVGVFLTALSLYTFVLWRHEVKQERHRKMISIAEDHMREIMGMRPPPGLETVAVGRRKFLVNDWNVYARWTDLRRDIEHSLMIATLLDRELVLPAFVYASACQYKIDKCVAVASTLVKYESLDIQTSSNLERNPDAGDPLHEDTHKFAPRDSPGWVVPIALLLDIQHLTAKSPHAIQFNKYLEVVTAHEPDLFKPSLGQPNGQWSAAYNHKMSYQQISGRFFDFATGPKIDRLPPTEKPLFIKNLKSGIYTGLMPEATSEVIEKCHRTLKTLDKLHSNATKTIYSKKEIGSPGTESRIWNDDVITSRLEFRSGMKKRENMIFESCLATGGYRSVYGYGQAGWRTQAPINPTRYITDVQTLSGIWDDLDVNLEQILHIEGVENVNSPPGAMLWSTTKARDDFTHLATTAFRMPKAYSELASRLEKRMREKCGGRAWRAVYLNNNTSVTNDPLPDPNSKDELQLSRLISKGLEDSVSTLSNRAKLLKPFQRSFGTGIKPPQSADPVYVAADHTGRNRVEHILGKVKIVRLEDLLEDTDREGFSAFVFRDALELVEHSLLIRAGYFIGQPSIASGWVINQREAIGVDEQLTHLASGDS